MENRRGMIQSGTVKPGYFRVAENKSYTDPSQYTNDGYTERKRSI